MQAEQTPALPRSTGGRVLRLPSSISSGNPVPARSKPPGGKIARPLWSGVVHARGYQFFFLKIQGIECAIGIEFFRMGVEFSFAILRLLRYATPWTVWRRWLSTPARIARWMRCGLGSISSNLSAPKVGADRLRCKGGHP